MANIKDLLGESYREDMTNDEIVEAIKGVNLPKDTSDERDRIKKQLDNACSEAADLKRQLKAKMSEDEKQRAEAEEKYSLMETENAELRKQIAIADYTAKFIGSGLDAETATKTAEAAYTGDIDTVIANYNNRIAKVQEEVKAKLIADNPVLTGGSKNKVKDYSTQISEAMASGDMSTAAAFMRLQQENNKND